jgi:hypothetical protein
MWPLRRSENRQDNDSKTGILKYGDAAPKQYWRFAPNCQWLQIFFNCSNILKTDGFYMSHNPLSNES